MLPPLVPSAPSTAAGRPPGSFFMPPLSAAQQPSLARSPAQDLASQPFDTGAPAQILAQESPISTQGPLPGTNEPSQACEAQPAAQLHPVEGRRSSGFGQWLNNGITQAESQGADAIPPGCFAREGTGQGAQPHKQGSEQQQSWGLAPAQPAFRGEPVGGNMFTSYASVVEPVQHAENHARQAHALLPGQGGEGQPAAYPGGPGCGLPAGGGAPAIDSKEMKEIEL